jgi:hypothetical protein
LIRGECRYRREDTRKHRHSQIDFHLSPPFLACRLVFVLG